MTLVDVCGNCGTMFDKGEGHCRRCGTDRTDAVKREMREMCYTYTRDEPEDNEIARLVKPIFVPKWGKVQWYETGDGEPEAEDGPVDEGDTEGSEE